ncbi:NAPDH-dependent diflavin reductase, partial [Rhizoclosmatium sp. JEL0117]
MTRFWKWLLRKSLDGLFGGRSVAVFGLGDSAYQKFNYPAKKLFKRLIQLGATPLLGRGDGDDQHPLGLDGAFDPWCNKLWEALDARFPVPPNFTILPKNILPPPTYSIQFLTTSDIPQTTTPPTLYTAKCIQNTRITHPAHFQDVRHMVFDLSNTSANPPTYSPADVMTIYPSNSASDVQEALDFFEWSDIADTPFHLLSSTSTTTTTTTTSPTTNSLPFPQTLTLRQTLTHHLNLFGRPTSRHFFHLLSFFTTDVMHAEKLQEFASSEGHEE